MRVIEFFPKKRASYIISDQLLRAVTSIAANIVEAQAASSKKDFINFLNHALKSGNEAKFWFMLSNELEKNMKKRTNELVAETEELTKILGSSIKTLKDAKP